LAAVARRDSEWVYGEFADDINSVAAPVFDSDGDAVAALHVHGPSYRFPGDRDPDQVAAGVAAAAQQLSARLRRTS
jgi:DNA-binding IclR family transcriptional regulator